MLISMALRHKGVTYSNVTPDPRTWPILKAQGYKQYSSGTFIAVPALRARSRGCRVEMFGPDVRPGQDLQASEIELLAAHARYGCYSLICRSAGRRQPFVFAPRRRFGVVPVAHLFYCRDVEDFVRLAGPLGGSWSGAAFLSSFSTRTVRSAGFTAGTCMIGQNTTGA